MESAGNLPDSEVFSRPHFETGLNFQASDGYGRDGLVREAGRMADSMFRTSRPPVARLKAASGLQSQSGAEPMTTVNTTPMPKTGNITSPTQSATQNLGSISPLIRQQAIETALSLALFHTRKGDTQKAVAKSMRAASLLKQACAAAQIGGAQ